MNLRKAKKKNTRIFYDRFEYDRSHKKIQPNQSKFE